MNVKELAELSGVSVRTLHHYDRIGLLRPQRNQDNNYRFYTQKEIDRLQQILLFQACGFSLDAIARMLNQPGFDAGEACLLQRKALLYEQERIGKMLSLLKKSMDAMKGKNQMTNKDKFKGFDFSQNPYEKEARERWGNTAVDKNKAAIDSLDIEGQETLKDEMNSLFASLAALRHLPPDSRKAQEAMAGMYRYFNDRFGYHYSPQAFRGLGQMYVDDGRFSKNIDQFGEGLSQFLKEAMGLYADSLE